MDQNLTDDRTTVGSHDDRSSGGVFLMPSERRMREAVSIQPHARTLACAKPISRFGHCGGLSSPFSVTSRFLTRLGNAARRRL